MPVGRWWVGAVVSLHLHKHPSIVPLHSQLRFCTWDSSAESVGISTAAILQKTMPDDDEEGRKS